MFCSTVKYMKISCKNISLNTNIFLDENDKKCVLFLCGGSLKTGKERFLDWQHQLEKNGISSVAFDYVGVPGIRDAVKNSSLQSRIEETVTVVSWIKEKLRPTELIIYGVSMGGYVALGVVNLLPGAVSKLVLHAPAAYAKKAQKLLFDDSFTKIISQSESWSDSHSFSWIEQFEKPILLMQPEYDEVIPSEITRQYISIGNKKINFTHVHLTGSRHKCWSNSEADTMIREDISAHLVSFIQTEYPRL